MAINKVVFGTETLMDISKDTVTKDTLLQGITAHNAAGEAIIGEAISGGKTHTINALAKSWTRNSDGSYQQSFSVSGITASTKMGLSLYCISNTKHTNDEAYTISNAMSYINRIITENGKITLICSMSCPEVDINGLVLTEV